VAPRIYMAKPPYCLALRHAVGTWRNFISLPGGALPRQEASLPCTWRIWNGWEARAFRFAGPATLPWADQVPDSVNCLLDGLILMTVRVHTDGNEDSGSGLVQHTRTTLSYRCTYPPHPHPAHTHTTQGWHFGAGLAVYTPPPLPACAHYTTPRRYRHYLPITCWFASLVLVGTCSGGQFYLHTCTAAGRHSCNRTCLRGLARRDGGTFAIAR